MLCLEGEFAQVEVVNFVSAALDSSNLEKKGQVWDKRRLAFVCVNMCKLQFFNLGKFS